MLTGKALAVALIGLLAVGGLGVVFADTGSDDGLEQMRQVDLRKDDDSGDIEVDDRDDGDGDKGKGKDDTRDDTRAGNGGRRGDDTGGTNGVAAAPASAPAPQAAPPPAPAPAPAPAPYSDDGGGSYSGGGSS